MTAPNCALNPAKDCAEEWMGPWGWGGFLEAGSWPRGWRGLTLYPNQACASSYGQRKPFLGQRTEEEGTVWGLRGAFQTPAPGSSSSGATASGRPWLMLRALPDGDMGCRAAFLQIQTVSKALLTKPHALGCLFCCNGVLCGCPAASLGCKVSSLPCAGTCPVRPRGAWVPWGQQAVPSAPSPQHWLTEPT